MGAYGVGRKKNAGKSGSKGAGKGSGSGQGGPGIGKGGKASESGNKNVRFDKEKVKGQFDNKGEILGGIFVKGEATKGEAKREYVEAYKSEIQESTDALTKEDIPLGYKQFVSTYFDSIDQDAADDAPATEEGPVEPPGGESTPPDPGSSGGGK